MKNAYLIFFFTLVVFQSLAQPRFSYDPAGNRIQRLYNPVPDLTTVITLPSAVFYSPGASQNFAMNIYEVGGLNTSSGTVTISITAPNGYTLAFDNSLTSINVFGIGAVAVTNTKWALINNVANRQFTLKLNTGEFIAANSFNTNIGFMITRTTANTGSVSNLTANIVDDPGQTYDYYSINNIYSRVITSY